MRTPQRLMILNRPPVDSSAVLYRDAVVANGGTVSGLRLARLSQFIRAEKASGAWNLTDDYWVLWGEDAAQSLTSLKQFRLATAVNSPTFMANRGYTFDGATNYIDTAFVPSTHAVAMTGSLLRLAVYERANVAVSNTWAAGCLNSGTQNVLVNPRSAGGIFQLALNSSATTAASGITDSRGYSVGNRSTGPVFTGYKNGVSQGAVVPGANATTLPTVSLYLGAFNSSGTPSGFRATSLGLVCVGASLSAAQETAQYNAVQAFATAIGAQV